MTAAEPLVDTVIVNWTRWEDTLACLRSVLASSHTHLRVIVCDNASTDDSVAHLSRWLNDHHLPPRMLSEHDVARMDPHDASTCHPERVVLITNAENHGYAGGANVGLRYAMACRNTKYVWILNNDTTVDRDALRHMVQRIRETGAGICGARIVEWDSPDTVQVYGGNTYCRVTGLARRLDASRFRGRHPTPEEIEATLNYISGACALVSADFIRVVGLMSERYFLYFEELDWLARAAGRFKLAYAQDASVRHREGASAGSHPRQEQRSLTSEYYLMRARMLYARRFSPLWLPSILLVALARTLRVWTRDRQRSAVMLRAMADGVQGKEGRVSLNFRRADR